MGSGKMRITNFFKRALPVVLAASLLGGCSLGAKKDPLKELGEESSASIKMMYYDERSFYSQYGMVFSSLFPEIEFEVATTGNLYQEGKDYDESVYEFIEEENPDILMLSEGQYRKLAAEGKLYSIESVMESDGFDTEGIIPGIIEYIRELGDGTLYGLSPSFNAQALFYNKKLFDKYQITYPEDRMTWDEVLQLAARFPTDGSGEDRVFGLKAGYDTSLFGLATAIGTSEGLSIINADKRQVTINSDAWRRVFETSLNAIKSNAIYSQENDMMGGSFDYMSYLKQDALIGGKAAMVIEHSYMLNQLREAKNSLKEDELPDWDVVTAPIDPKNPDSSVYTSVGQVFAINAQSPNLRAAWKFLKYIHSDEYSRVSSKAQTFGGLPIRTEYLEDNEGRNMAAFYSLKPADNNFYKDYGKIPNSFFMEYQQLAETELKKVVDDGASLNDTLDSLQEKLQEALTLAFQNADKDKEASGEDVSAAPPVEVQETVEGSTEETAAE
ncbi:extracellular solute-binding protein [Paenibacillaceae bacterium]|nr:extracellular solute-binding protein [Paenibacillaceae bacterium]